MHDPQTERIAKEACTRNGFTFEGHMGSGTFKEVFKARQGNGANAAIKVSKPGSLSLRNIREAEAMKRLSHPGIAKLFAAETFNDGASQYIVTYEEWLDGGSLTDRAQKLTAGQLHFIGTALISALTVIWDLDLVHRDIKPDNIMFRRSGESPVLTDFGIVRDLSAQSLTQTSAWMGPGTPLFASPEQLNNEKEIIDARADQFGLSATLYYSATGRHPYQNATESIHQAIDNAAFRKGPSREFLEWGRTTGLTVLARMAAPWPIQRYRFPADLAKAWTTQKPN